MMKLAPAICAAVMRIRHFFTGKQALFDFQVVELPIVAPNRIHT
jgi:hypothetical protein